jgi:hypothetical protein
MARTDHENATGLQLGGIAVLARVELPDARIELVGEGREVGLLERARRDHDLLGLDPQAAGPRDERVTFT